MKNGEPQQYAALATIQSGDVRVRWARASMFVALNALAIPALARPELSNPYLRVIFAFFLVLLNCSWVISNRRSGRWIDFRIAKFVELEMLDRSSIRDSERRTRVLVFADPKYKELNKGWTVNAQLLTLSVVAVAIWLIVLSASIAVVLGWTVESRLFGILMEGVRR